MSAGTPKPLLTREERDLLVGKRVELVHCDEPRMNIYPGDCGTVWETARFCGMDILLVQWDKGFMINLIYGVDIWKVISNDFEIAI